MSNYLNSFYTSTNNTCSIIASSIDTDLINNDEFNTLESIDVSQPIQSQINTVSSKTTGISYNSTNNKTIINNLEIGQFLQSGFNQTSAGLNDYITKSYADSHYGITGSSTGTPGNNAYVSCGSTITLPPGSLASVSNTGTPSNAIFNFSIPVGSNGLIGPTGPIGYTGPQGVQGDRGPKGDDGNQASSTLASIAAASSSAVSASASASYAALSAEYAAASQTNSAGLNSRVQVLEDVVGTNPTSTGQTLQNKTKSMYHSTDISNKNHTSFTDYLEVNNSNDLTKIILNGNSSSIKLNNIDTLSTTDNLSIGVNNGILTTINIGNSGCLTNFNGAVNFNFQSIIGTFSQF